MKLFLIESWNQKRLSEFGRVAGGVLRPVDPNLWDSSPQVQLYGFECVALNYNWFSNKAHCYFLCLGLNNRGRLNFRYAQHFRLILPFQARKTNAKCSSENERYLVNFFSYFGLFKSRKELHSDHWSRRMKSGIKLLVPRKESLRVFLSL